MSVRTPAAWIRDRAGRRAWLVAEAGYEGLLDRFARHVDALPDDQAQPDAAFEIHEEDPAQFLKAVRRSLEYIAAGDVYLSLIHILPL